MARKKTPCRTAGGLFARNLGWVLTPAGTYARKKFHLGRDEDAARLANLRLEHLRQEWSDLWAAKDRAPAATDRPVRDAVSLAPADAVRAGEPVAYVPLPPGLDPDDGLGVGLWLDDLRAAVKAVRLEPADVDARAGGRSPHDALDAYGRHAEGPHRSLG